MPKPRCNHGNPWDDCPECEWDDTPTTTEETVSLQVQMEQIAISNRPTVNLRHDTRPITGQTDANPMPGLSGGSCRVRE
jgi:hypothetical protein